jgi:hypothetical protein
MSGVEVAGLALGALPILIQAIGMAFGLTATRADNL